MINLNFTLKGAAYVSPLCLHSSTSYFELPNSYEINWSSEVSVKSLIGNTESKTLYKPWLLSLFPKERNCSYDAFCTSI